MDYGLRDRVVLITGAGGGAGPTIAAAFAAEGAIVALHHRAGSDRLARGCANTYVSGEVISLTGGGQA